MTIYIENESDIKLNIPYRKIIEDSINLSLDFEKVPYECEISVTIVDDERIHEINKEFREIDRSTDVLSFPLNEFEKVADWQNFDEDKASFNYDTGELMLGDIILSAEHIIKQANEYGHTRKRELAFLVIHSILHLLGYDHMTKEDEEKMFSRQRQILDLGGYKR
jgi:metalloprotein, YbeY family